MNFAMINSKFGKYIMDTFRNFIHVTQILTELETDL